METVLRIIAFAKEYGQGWGALIVALGSAIEYVFPPFPGDSVVIAASVLIPTAGWSLWVVFAATMIGSTIGAVGDWRLGIWLADKRKVGDESRVARWLTRPSVTPRYEWVVDKFERHGPKFLAVNRFLPVFRSFFFIAAGLARIPLRSVVFWAMLSAAAWNALLMGVGYLVGHNIETLVSFVQRYTVGVIGVVVLLFVGAKLWSFVRK